MTATTNQNRAAAFRAVSATECGSKRFVNTTVLIVVAPLAVDESEAHGGRRPSFPCAGLFLPALFVHAHHEEPQGQRSLPEHAGGEIVGGQNVCEWRR